MDIFFDLTCMHVVVRTKHSYVLYITKNTACSLEAYPGPLIMAGVISVQQVTGSISAVVS